jgi:plasmid stabilization system protein ParE
VTEYRLTSEPRADLDIESVFQWYENEQQGLGLEFLDELRATYGRVIDGPLKYKELRSGIRRALVKRFPYAIYFAVEGDHRGACCASRKPRSSRMAEAKTLISRQLL